jgi:hypothetical protein
MMGCSFLGGWYRLLTAYGNNPRQPENPAKQTEETGPYALDGK